MLTGFKSIRAKSDNTNRDWINAPCKCMPYWFLILWFDKRDPVYYANGQNTTTNLHFPSHIARIRVIIVRSGDENSFRNVHRVASLSIYFRTRVFSNKVPKMTVISCASSRGIIDFKIRVTNLLIANESRFSRRVIVLIPVICFEIFIVNFYRWVFIDEYMGTIMRLIIFIEK